MNHTYKSLENSPKLFDLLRELRTSKDTPSLISWITEDADRLQLAGKLASVSKVSDPASYQWLLAACGKVGYSFEAMQDRVRPVARALGLYNIQHDKNYYQLLGIHQDATENQIRTAYRTRARRIHPDTRGDNKMDEEAFTALTTAYKTLSNPLLRREYDQELFAVGVWNEGPKYHRYKSKRRQRSKVKYFFLFCVISLILAVIILFSDVFFNMSVMQEIEKQLFVQYQKITSASENITTSKQSDSSTESNPSVHQSSSSSKEKLKEPSKEKGPSGKANSALSKLNSQDSKQAEKPSSEVTKNKKQNATTPDTKVDAEIDSAEPGAKTGQGVLSKASQPNEQLNEIDSNGWIAEVSGPEIDGQMKITAKRSGEMVKPLAPFGLIEKQKRERLQFELKVVDLIKNPPTRNSIQLFLDRYTSVYQARNEDQFFNLFTPDAKENEEPINRIFPIYRQTFRDFEKIDYDIRLREYLVDLDEAVIKLKGEYRLDWNSRKDGKRHTSKGLLSMILETDSKGGYKVKALNY